MTKNIFKPLVALVLTILLFCVSSLGSLITSAAWYQHSTPATVTAGSPLTSPSRTYDGNYMGIELTVQTLSPDVTGLAGLIVEPIINGVGGTRYYVSFTGRNYAKLDNIPIPNGAHVKLRYTVFGTNLYSVTLTRVVTYSWTA